MNLFAFITWDINPNIIESPIMIRYYGLLFGLAFFAGFTLMKKMFANEKISEEWLDKILMYAVVGTVVGARLGHVFFYEWDYYSQHLLEIPQVWKGGLASHGAAIAIVIAMWIYAKRVTKGTKTVLWTLDKVVLTVALAAGLIRVGNLMNSEIVGDKSNANTAFFFQYETKNSLSHYFTTEAGDITLEHTDKTIEKNGFNYPISSVTFPIYNKNVVEEDINEFYKSFSYYKHYDYQKESKLSADKELHYFVIDNRPTVSKTADGYVVHFDLAIIPRIPTQILEAVSYFIVFILLFWGYWKREWYKKEGLIFGVFFLLMFSARFIIEFWKEHQTDALAEASLNMGQWLSIPGIVIGLVFIVLALRKKTV
ncbi:MAG: prolipoprotein diacylglyceryl transferase [Flavobacteriales bacterium]|jgi:prolipoprotein diacylglyceryl transferase|nr:prolipoprotein diacylglyceryl transferase [Flavobacteriales bacterium]